MGTWHFPVRGLGAGLSGSSTMRCAEVNFIHIRAHSASRSLAWISFQLVSFPGLTWKSPLALLPQGLGLWVLGCCWWWAGSAVPLPVCSRPSGPEAWAARGCPAAARGELLVAVLRSQLSGEHWPSSAPAAPAAASGLLLQKGALSGLQYFLWALAVFLWDRRRACELGMPGYACLEKTTKQKELGDEEQKGSVLPSPSLASGPSCKADLGSPE